MKPELSVSTQSAMLNTRAPVAVADVAGERGQAAKDRQTLRPVAQAAAPSEIKTRPQNNNNPEVSRTRLAFSVDDSSGRMIVSILDKDTSEVVRQIPAEELLAIARHIEERLKSDGQAEGLFVEDQA